MSPLQRKIFCMSFRVSFDATLQAGGLSKRQNEALTQVPKHDEVACGHLKRQKTGAALWHPRQPQSCRRAAKVSTPNDTSRLLVRHSLYEGLRPVSPDCACSAALLHLLQAVSQERDRFCLRGSLSSSLRFSCRSVSEPPRLASQSMPGGLNKLPD